MRPLPRTASSLLAAAASRLARAPYARDWGEALAALAILVGAGAGLSLWSEAPALDITFAAARADPGRIAAVAVIAFFIPALAEEAVFRGLAQPARMRGARAVAASGLSLAAFIVWHPLQVALGLPSGQAVFLEPAFLAMAGLLGLVCTVLVHRSGGLWTAVVVHWAVVVAWKAGAPAGIPVRGETVLCGVRSSRLMSETSGGRPWRTEPASICGMQLDDPRVGDASRRRVRASVFRRRI